MKYLLLLCAEPENNPVPGAPEFDTMMDEFFSLADRMKNRAKILAGEGLLGAETAKTLRLRDGSALTTDGPYAETREHLGGFYFIEAASMEDALAFAAAIPVARYGSVEIRPIEVFE